MRERLSDVIRAPFRSLQGCSGGQKGSSDTQGPDNVIWALKDVSFNVEQGEVVGIIGRNGAGKSTLLKVLSRITEPTEGIATIRGRVGSLLEVGTGFHPDLTGRDNIYLSGALLGMTKTEITGLFDEIIDFAEVEKFIDTPVKHYSSGMYTRLAFSVAAHLNSEVLLVDEVLAVGDVAFQKKCLGRMGTVAKGGRTILFISHNMAAIRTLCSRAVLLGDGRSLMQGTTESVISAYLAEEDSDLPAIVELPRATGDAPGSGMILRTISWSGDLRSNFRIGELWRVVVEFEMVEPAKAVIVGVGLVSVEGTPIITYWSEAKDLVPGQYMVEFDCDVSLAQCRLRFNVGLSSQGRPFYYVMDHGLVSIAEVAELEQPFRASGSGFLISDKRPEIVRADSLEAKGVS